jgi:hypothetical protein
MPAAGDFRSNGKRIWAMSISASQKTIMLNGRRLWSGQFHFLVSPECDIDYLKGAKGGFVSAIATAPSELNFIDRATSALEERMLRPDAERDLIEEITASYLDGKLSDEWVRLCELTLETGEVGFNGFDLYNSD